MPRYDDDYDPPTRQRPTKKSNQTLILGLAVGGGALALFLAGVCVVGFLVMSKDSSEQYTKIDADDLVAEWKRNPAAAAAKYRSQGVEVTGRLHAINANIHGQTYIDVRGPVADDANGTHIFVLSESAKRGLAKCQVGATVRVRAHATGDAHDRPWLRADEIFIE